MAKQFVQISLATKLRTLFGVAVLGIIAAALIVPWYFMELLAEQGASNWLRAPRELRRRILNRSVPETSPLARIVGAEAYVAAGGVVIGIRRRRARERRAA